MWYLVETAWALRIDRQGRVVGKYGVEKIHHQLVPLLRVGCDLLAPIRLVQYPPDDERRVVERPNGVLQGSIV